MCGPPNLHTSVVLVVGCCYCQLYSTGPQRSWERSGTHYCQQALQSVWYDALKGLWSALKSLPSNLDLLDPKEEVPKTRALQSAPRFLGPLAVLISSQPPINGDRLLNARGPFNPSTPHYGLDRFDLETREQIS
ncbi:hypothetical protein AG1IA_07122 [Rhizoctonia solani AG-1 IA]|uniref:Uncharacterized protein n=1 Tax=Thanatephorus cucumeris (strain AG1-IA) TaxID=983506 RepID=L8WL12_THACA|nr:hypothetical protein AG1IA_07122 [Rhizoctonia solani AG-1 IA]